MGIAPKNYDWVKVGMTITIYDPDRKVVWEDVLVVSFEIDEFGCYLIAKKNGDELPWGLGGEGYYFAIPKSSKRWT